MSENSLQKESQQKPSGFRVHEEPLVDAGVSVESSKYANPSHALEEASRHDPLSALGNLPPTYGSNRVVLMAQEPHWLFVYWDFDISRHPGGKLFLRSCDAAGNVEKEVEVAFETRNWYLPAAHANAQYFAELGCYRGERWHSIGRSNSVQTPPDRMSEDNTLDYAALPLHISFQHMLQQLAELKSSDESLLSALSRLRREGKLSGMENFLFPDGALMSRALLEMLLGKDLADQISSGTISSEEAEKLLQQKLEENIHSGRSSESFSSWNEAAFSSWLKTLPELQSVSSFEEFRKAKSSWSTSEFSSWLQHASSSWSQGALSSGILSTLSSWGSSESSSWGGQRGFFMNVNAEVIFYGGTDPRAKVWIDGKSIALNPDGTFRYHFRFPDGDCEIPILAESPDGVEQRSATLHFRRQTDKSAGVDPAAQPPHLTDPLI